MNFTRYAGLAALLLSPSLWAAEAAPGPAASLLRTMLGLIVVLAVMAGIAWFMKRVGPAARGGNAQALRIVGGVSVGSREKVVVLEVGGRWLVVGVAPGQVNAIADLEAMEIAPAAADAGNNVPGAQTLAAKGQAFAGWLRNALDKSNAK